MTIEDQSHHLAAAAVALVAESSSGVARGLARAIAAGGLVVADDTVRRWASTIGSRAARNAARRFLGDWAEQAPEIEGTVAVGALLAAAEASDRRIRDEQIEVVWTGPTTKSLPLRRTEQVLLQMVEAATTTLTIASYAVFRIPRINAALVDATRRGVAVRILLERDESAVHGGYDTFAAIDPVLRQSCACYEWPPDERPRRPDGSPALMHLKCAVADARVLFITSANLTEYALSENMELGLLVSGSEVAAQVQRHFDDLIERAVLRRAPL